MPAGAGKRATLDNQVLVVDRLALEIALKYLSRVGRRAHLS